jgi:energy-coupling factor transport system permease protein
MARRLVAGSLDRAVDIAATLELRGYARGAPRAGGGRRPSRHSRLFALAGIAVVAVGVGAAAAGIGEFEAYPTIAIDADAPTLAVAAALPVLAASPFIAAGALRPGRRRRRG